MPSFRASLVLLALRAVGSLAAEPVQVHRRALIAKATALATSAALGPSIVSPAHAAVSAEADAQAQRLLGPLVSAQAGLQRQLQPGTRVPLLRTAHAWQESWQVPADPATFLAKLSDGLLAQNEKDSRGFVFVLDEADAQAGRAQVSVFTRKRWLDIVTIELAPAGAAQSTATVKCVSSGLFPLSVPGAPVLNVPLFFFPFGDQRVSELKTCPELRKATGLDIRVLSKGRLI